MNGRKLIVLLTLLLAPLAGILFVVTSPEVAHPRFSKPETGLIVATTLLNIGSILLFVSGLFVYKPKMQRAYTALAVAITLNTVAVIQFPIIDRYQLLDGAWVKYGGVIVPFIVASILVYMSMRSFAKLVGIKSWLTKPYIVISLCLLAAIVPAMLPHVATHQLETELDANLMIQTWGGTLNLAAAMLVWRVWKGIGAHYKRAIAWLLAVLVGSSAAFFLNVGHTLLVAETKDWITLALYILATTVASWWLVAGYMFARTRDY